MSETLSLTGPDVISILQDMSRRKAPADKISQVYFTLVAKLNGNLDPESQAAAEKILSGVQVRGRTVTAEFREWVETQRGIFNLAEYQRQAAIDTKEAKHSLVVAATRLCEEGLLERTGQRIGEYRIVDSKVEYMDYVNVPSGNGLNIALPLGIHKKTVFFPKNVVVLAGVTGFGKTTFLLNLIRDNPQYRFKYFMSEMSPKAFNFKLSHFPQPIDQWNMDAIPDDQWDYFNIHDKIFPNEMNVIDYLEPEGERTFNIHAVVTKIIRKLDQGMAFIATQKKAGADLSAGGVYSAKAASLYLSLDWGSIYIFKNRYRELDKQAWLDRINFEISSGQHLKATSGWYSKEKNRKTDIQSLVDPDFPREA